MQKAMKDLQDNLIKEKKLVKELQSQLATTQDTMKSADVESERDQLKFQLDDLQSEYAIIQNQIKFCNKQRDQLESDLEATKHQSSNDQAKLTQTHNSELTLLNEKHEEAL